MKNKLSYIALIAITAFALIWGGNLSKSIIHKNESLANWDGYGYYVHLPSVLIYKDVERYEKVHPIAQSYHIATGYQTLPLNDSIQLPVYPVGQAVSWFPFFELGHVVAQFTDYKADGFSAPYQWALFLSSICFIFLGFYFNRKLLLHFFSDGITALAMLLIFFATNYFYYSLYEISMPHVYLYAYFAMMLYYGYQYQLGKKNKYLLFSALAFGMGVLTRNSELFWIIIPILFGLRLQDFFSFTAIKTMLQRTAIYLGTACLLYFIFQIGYYSISTHQWYVNGYVGHSFNLLHPNIVNCLFGFYKGWFIYTPIAVLFILGIAFIYSKKRTWLLSFIMFTLLYLYLLVSWDDWTYGSTFGFRPIVQSYALFVIPLAYCLQAFFKKYSVITLIIGLLLVALNLVQTYQFSNGILLREPFEFAYYKKVFLKLTGDRHDRIIIDIPSHHDGKNHTIIRNLYEQKQLQIPPATASTTYPIFSLSSDKNIRLQTEIIYSYFGDSYNAWNQPRLITYATPATNNSYWTGLRLPEIMRNKKRDTITFNQLVSCNKGDSIKCVLENQIPDSLLIHSLSIHEIE